PDEVLRRPQRQVGFPLNERWHVLHGGRPTRERERPITHGCHDQPASPTREARSIMACVDDAENVVAFPQAPEAIELRHLRAFVAVAEELNFGRAAERLFITQPALSRQIRALEQLMGCELLRRSTHRVELTVAGEALLDRVRPLLRDVDAAVSTVQSLGGELVERVARLWEPLVQAVAADAEIEEQRLACERMLAHFPVPPEVS